MFVYIRLQESSIRDRSTDEWNKQDYKFYIQDIFKSHQLYRRQDFRASFRTLHCSSLATVAIQISEYFMEKKSTTGMN